MRRPRGRIPLLGVQAGRPWSAGRDSRPVDGRLWPCWALGATDELSLLPGWFVGTQQDGVHGSWKKKVPTGVCSGPKAGPGVSLPGQGLGRLAWRVARLSANREAVIVGLSDGPKLARVTTEVQDGEWETW